MMVIKVLKWMAVVTVVGLFLLWIATGGISAAIAGVKTSPNPAKDVLDLPTLFNKIGRWGMKLPWQPDPANFGFKDLTGLDASSGSSGNVTDDIAAAQDQLTAIESQMNQAKAFGTPSPYRGKVSLENGSLGDDNEAQYARISASYDNTAPIDVSSWSLQSAVSGTRAYIPRGADTFLMGSINEQGDIYIAPGTDALLSSGTSPVGTSFRENMCSGYLGQMQTYTPPFSADCPSAASVLSPSAENLQTYGASCFDAIANLPSCAFPTSLPSSISASCRTFLTNTFSYNGCVQRSKSRSDFRGSTWRVFLGAPSGTLWNTRHDVIKLLDHEGRTVDMLTY